MWVRGLTNAWKAFGLGPWPWLFLLFEGLCLLLGPPLSPNFSSELSQFRQIYCKTDNLSFIYFTRNIHNHDFLIMLVIQYLMINCRWVILAKLPFAYIVWTQQTASIISLQYYNRSQSTKL